MGLVKISSSSWWKWKENHRLKQVAEDVMRYNDPYFLRFLTAYVARILSKGACWILQN